MSGLSPVSAFTGGMQFTAVVQNYFARSAVIGALGDFVPNQVSSLFSQNYSGLNSAVRSLNLEGTFYDSASRGVDDNQSKLSKLIDGFNSINDSLSQIRSLVQDTISTPGNAAANQAAIDTLNASIKEELRNLRLTSTNPGFDIANVDPGLSNFNVSRLSSSLVASGQATTIDLNITTAAQRAIRTDFINNFLNANGPLRFQIAGPLGWSPTIDISPTRAL